MMNGFQQKLVDRLLDSNARHVLSPWEARFLADIKMYPDSRPLTGPENSKLNEIGNKLHN